MKRLFLILLALVVAAYVGIGLYSLLHDKRPLGAALAWPVALWNWFYPPIAKTEASTEKVPLSK